MTRWESCTVKPSFDTLRHLSSSLFDLLLLSFVSLLYTHTPNAAPLKESSASPMRPAPVPVTEGTSHSLLLRHTHLCRSPSGRDAASNGDRWFMKKTLDEDVIFTSVPFQSWMEGWVLRRLCVCACGCVHAVWIHLDVAGLKVGNTITMTLTPETNSFDSYF